jgi:hypothetical protein
VRPVGAGALQRKRRARPRLSRRALEPAAAAEVVAAAPDTLHADAEERIVIAEEVPPAPPAAAPAPSRARQAWWTWALPLLLLVLIAAGVGWYEFLREPPPAAGPAASGEAPATAPAAAPGATTAVDLVELKKMLRRLDFTPGPDEGGLDDATRDAIRQYQHTAGEPETGEPSAALLDELRQVAAPLKPEGSPQ